MSDAQLKTKISPPVEKPRKIVDLTGFYTGSENKACMITSCVIVDVTGENPVDVTGEKVRDWWGLIGSLPRAAEVEDEEFLSGLFSDTDSDASSTGYFFKSSVSSLSEDTYSCVSDDSDWTPPAAKNINSKKHPGENVTKEQAVSKRLRSSSCGYEEEV
jgi:hypothetical protein